MDRRFAIIPEWVIDAPISDTAYRLYSVLLRYGQTSGQRMPGRATLARRLHKKSTDTVDRALKELVDLGAVTVEHRYAGRQRLSNRYHLITDTPGGAVGKQPTGRRLAATPIQEWGVDGDRASADVVVAQNGGRSPAATGSPIGAAAVAAPMRHDPGGSTQIPPPPTSPATTATGGDPVTDAEQQRLLGACGISDLDVLAAHCQQLRRTAGKPTAR